MGNVSINRRWHSGNPPVMQQHRDVASAIAGGHTMMAAIMAQTGFTIKQTRTSVNYLQRHGLATLVTRATKFGAGVYRLTMPLARVLEALPLEPVVPSFDGLLEAWPLPVKADYDARR